MNNFGICKNQTVRMFLKADLETVKANLNENEVAVETQYFGNPSFFYLDNNQIKPLPPQPAVNYSFDFTLMQWVNTNTEEQQWFEIKQKRNLLLSESDWTVLEDVKLSNKNEWILYRQSLRDITNQLDPFNITWPTPP